MLYQLLKIDGRNITYSESMNKNGKEQIRIYSDELNPVKHCINELEFYLPDYKITKKVGYTDQDVQNIINHVKCAEEIIWDRARRAAKELASK